jgi:hypothetical protein
MLFDPDAGPQREQRYATAAAAAAASAAAQVAGGGAAPFGAPPAAAHQEQSARPGAYARARLSSGAPGPPPAGAAAGPPPDAGGARPAAPVSLRDCGAADLLEHLPSMQRLMLKAVGVAPVGAAAKHPLCLVRGGATQRPPCAQGAALRMPHAAPASQAQPPPTDGGASSPATWRLPPPPRRRRAPLPSHPPTPPTRQAAASWALRESRAVYRAASEGVVNLADVFFDMGRDDAMRWGGVGGWGCVWAWA